MVDVRVVCGQRECANTAVERMFWPGREPTLVCEPHLLQALVVAGAMGFALHHEPYTAWPWSCGDEEG